MGQSQSQNPPENNQNDKGVYKNSEIWISKNSFIIYWNFEFRSIHIYTISLWMKFFNVISLNEVFIIRDFWKHFYILTFKYFIIFFYFTE